MDKETLSNYGWIVICVLVLAVMIALATPFGNFIKTGVENTATGLVETSNKGIDVALSATGTPNNNGGNEPSVPIIRNGIIPDGATYTPNGGTAILGNGTNTFPDTVQTGDMYEEGDYIYKYNQYCEWGWKTNESQDGWGVGVNNTSKTSYGDILSEIAGQSINTMSYTFSFCTSLTTAPTIPNNVTNMGNTFSSCTSLTTAPAIPNSVTNMEYTFTGCTSLTTAPDMSNANSVTNMNGTFAGCTRLTTAPIIPNSVTSMSYTFRGCTSLTTAPAIPSSVTNMQYTFATCTSLTTAPAIPNSVTNMQRTFNSCTSLTTAPAIPNSVTNMNGTFNSCTALTGIIEVNTNPTDYMYCLSGTQITGITGSCSQTTKNRLMATK